MRAAWPVGTLALATIAALAAVSPSFAQTKPKTGTQAAPEAAAPGFAALTADECKKLGGSVYTAPNCKKTGTRCVMRLPGGQVNAPCIDEVE
jgi:hypothetical protein